MPKHIPPMKLILSLALAGSLALQARAAVASSASSTTERVTAQACAGAITAPFELVLGAPAAMLAPGAGATIEGTIRAQAALSSVSLSFKSEGSSQLLAPPQLRLDNIASGEERTFSIPVTLKDGTPASVNVHAIATSDGGEFTWERNESFFVIFRNDRPYSGTGSFLQLELQAIEDDLSAGRLSEEDARIKTKQLLILPGQFDQSPRVSAPMTPEQAQYGSLIQPAPAPSQTPRLPDPQSPQGCITVQGNVSWLDENGNSHPAFGMTVQVWDDDLIFDEFVAVMATNANGDYAFSVDNNDGLGQGDRDIYVKFVTANNAIEVKPPGILSSPYEADSPTHDETPCDATITENFTAANTGTGPAVNLNEAGSWIAVYTADRLNGGSFLGQIGIEWPGDPGSANYNGSRINLRPGDRWDWDVEFHEYGHYIQDTFNTEDNPGGPHNIGDCISDVHSSKSEGVRMAWGEGWPTYNGTVAMQILNLAALNVPRVGDVSYADTGESNFSYSLETQNNLGLGEDNEIAVQRIFWDLFDAASDGRDNVQASDMTLFNIVNGVDPTTLSAAWAAIRPTLSDSDDLAFGAVTTDHQVGPRLLTPASGAIVSPSLNNNLTWNRNVGCSTTYDGDSFTLSFFNAANSAPILSIPVGNTTSHALTLAEFLTLVGVTHDVRWAVEGSNGDSPATGPYLGESFAITVNRPPVANAGPDQPSVECTSQTTTPAQLNGTASSDPDGDPLTYTWSAAGIIFNDEHSATPIGQFPEGTTVVTLVVSDGIESDSDGVSITIVDTTPPSIVCPLEISVECVDHCGTPKNDPQLVPFFAGASATDICDDTPTLTNDAPTCLPHGDTVVTFTATDDDNNASSCQATVHVVDTTPPEITVELNRDVLWPPNHKLSTITASVTVTDICDPNPTFVLTSIVSSEPDNGLGDGDTADDIQGAVFGQSDTEFQLRSERAGGGPGRIYTIYYLASDFAGNTTADTSYVRVPHDQSGVAKASLGFTSEGTSVRPDAKTFTLVISGRPSLPANGFDPHEIYVGNHLDAHRPVNVLIRDLDADQTPDLAVTFDAAWLRTLRAASGEAYAVGLHYSTEAADYQVPDIFALGTPMSSLGLVGAVYGQDPGGKGDPIEPGPEPGSEAGTQAKLAPEPAPDAKDLNELAISTSGHISVEVFDVQGRRVRTLLNGEFAAGRYTIHWDGRMDTGSRAPSGVYFYNIQAPGIREVRKVHIMR
jgi:hypothetical protein